MIDLVPQPPANWPDIVFRCAMSSCNYLNRLVSNHFCMEDMTRDCDCEDLKVHKLKKVTVKVQ